MTVITFKSKSEIFAFIDVARSLGISASVIPVPKELKRGCGLAVEIKANQVFSAYSLVKRANFSTFGGIYSLKRINGKTKLQKIY